MNRIKIVGLGMAICMLYPPYLQAGTNSPDDNMFRRATKQIEYLAALQAAGTSSNSPLWLNANTYGLSAVEGNNGYLRLGLFHNANADHSHNWRLGYGVDLAVSYNFTNTFTIQQLYADFDYKKVRLSIGSKERPMQLKNQRLSSGSQTFGINSRPIPDVRFEIPEYISLTGKSNWVGIKGHFGYGMMTDGRWQEDYVSPGQHYAKKALYHSKAGYLRLGNEDRFPLVFEGGLEMACQFGGTIYNPRGINIPQLKMGHGIKDFFKAIAGGGRDATDDAYSNAAGNTVGSWVFSLSYKAKDWKIRAYYDHFFEDHSMMFFEYGWLDGMVGAELTLPKNPFISSFVYEYLNTTYQAGPIYHDHTSDIPDQISGVDNYYNHNLYQGWQHWGQAIGNPLFHSPLYNNNQSLEFLGNRFRAHHIGIAGNPSAAIDYRLLYSTMKNWGLYAAPFSDKKYSHSFLAEVNCDFSHFKKLKMNGWSVSAAFAFDRSNEIGNNTGAKLTIRKCGLLIK